MSVLLGSAAATTSARGQERAQPVPTAESERDRVVRDFEQGRSAHLAGRLEEAELLYLRTWARLKSVEIAANLGQVQLVLGKPASAAKHLAYGVRTVGPEIEPQRLARMLALLEAAKARAGTLQVRVKNVADAEVYVDGERVPEDAVKHELYVEPGEHTLVIRRAGYEDEVVRLVAAPGVTETVMPELKPKAVKAPETSAAGAKVPGAGGSKGAQGAAAAAKGEAKTKAPAAGARVEEQRSWVPVIALGAASAVGLGVAVGFTVASNDASADAHRYSDVLARANEQCIAPRGEFMETCTQTSDAASRAGTMGDLALGSYIVSAGLAIAAAAYAVWPNPQKSTETAVRVTPFGGSRTAGVIVAGAW
ncbi:hypothetical protein WMF39_39760 [Sorangium sp. So ce1504]|uniref:hypothetical protein n=1 Tax=Sorangium sp. So ce1504 TaxID=3133337 RepID=UPI003F60E83B